MDKYYTSIIFVCVFSMMSMGVCVASSNLLTDAKKRQFASLFAVIIVASVCEWMGQLLQNAGAETRTLHIAVKAVELSIAPFIGVSIASIVSNTKPKKLVVLCLGLHALLECLSGWWGFIYTVDAMSRYEHASLYWIYVLVYMLGMIYAIFVAVTAMKQYQYQGMPFLGCMTVVILFGVLIQLYDSNIRVVWLMLAIGAMILYIFHSEMIQQTDALTLLINRRGYEVCLANIQQPVAMLYFDVDQFKTVNDQHGHSYGDRCLKTVGDSIREEYAPFGKCFRIGGDEFCAILSMNSESVEQLNSEFLKKIGEKRAADERFPCVSLGYVFYDPANNNIEDAVAEADAMMYRNKNEKKEQTDV